MNEKAKNFLMSGLNVFVVALVLLFIVMGLSHIGLLDLSSLSLFGASNDHADDSADAELADILNGASVPDGMTVLTADMTPESVREMLCALTPAESYMHDLEYTVYADGVGSQRRVSVLVRPGVKLAYYVSPITGAYKQILEKDGATSVSTRSGGRVRTKVYATGDVSFDGEVGIIRTPDDFLNTLGEDGYTYSLLSGDAGTLMLITFTTQSGSYSQTQTYKLNLDFGIVTEAACYENGRLIYSMTTNALSEDGLPDFEIAEGFSELLPDELRPTDEHRSHENSTIEGSEQEQDHQK